MPTTFQDGSSVAGGIELGLPRGDGQPDRSGISVSATGQPRALIARHPARDYNKI
jgi:hypothetical protein